MAWKAEEGEQMVAMQASDIKWAQWIRVARNYQLRVGLKDRSKETFDGFVREVSQRSFQGLWAWTGMRDTCGCSLRRELVSRARGSEMDIVDGLFGAIELR